VPDFRRCERFRHNLLHLVLANGIDEAIANGIGLEPIHSFNKIERPDADEIGARFTSGSKEQRRPVD
jgi:hypothetical protein